MYLSCIISSGCNVWMIHYVAARDRVSLRISPRYAHRLIRNLSGLARPQNG